MCLVTRLANQDMLFIYLNNSTFVQQQRLSYMFLLGVLGLRDLAGLESPQVLKGFHKTETTRVRFCICIQWMHYKFKNAFFGSTLCKNVRHL